MNPGVRGTLAAHAAFNSAGRASETRTIQKRPTGELFLAPLPGSRREVEEIAALFYASADPARVFTGARSTETMVKALNDAGELSRYLFVHFAVHGLLPDDIRGLAEPSLVLSVYGDPANDGVLTMGEILGFKLNADLVTLSACQTGVEKSAGGRFIDGGDHQGLSGLARAFFFAGTPRLLATLWNISDEGTSEFMKHLYRALKARAPGQPITTALTAAREQMLAGPLAHPYFWAPFILLGEWR